MEADATTMNGREITAEKASELFAKHCRRRRRLPRPDQCYRLAITINVIRHDNRRDGGSYRHIFERQNKRRSENRPHIEWLEKRIEEKREEFELLHYPQGIQVLETAVALLSPPADPLIGQRKNAWWHKAALMIALEVRDIMESVDSSQKISFEKGGPLAEVVREALELAGIDCQPGAVAAAISQPTQPR